MRKLLFWLILSTAARAQISGAGQLSCNAAPVTGTGWTSSTAVNTTQVLLSNVSSGFMLVTLDQTTTITGGAISFLGNPGDGNFVTLNSWQVVDPTTAPFATISLPYTLVASTNKQFLIQTAGYVAIQLKLTTAITGTATVTPFSTMYCGRTPDVVYQNTNSNLQETSVLQDGTSTQMGNMANFGTSPGAVKSLNVNASVMSGTTALGTPNTFGTTAPSGNALGVNASLFCGTAVCGTSAAPANVTLTVPTSIFSGQQAVTATATALASQALTKGICVQALSTNSISVFIGPSGVTTSTGIELPAKAAFCVNVSNVNALFVIASTTGASVTWSGN